MPKISTAVQSSVTGSLWTFIWMFLKRRLKGDKYVLIGSNTNGEFVMQTSDERFEL